MLSGTGVFQTGLKNRNDCRDSVILVCIQKAFISPKSNKTHFRNSNFDFCGTFLVNKHFSVVKDALDASGYKTHAQMVLEHPSTDK